MVLLVLKMRELQVENLCTVPPLCFGTRLDWVLLEPPHVLASRFSLLDNCFLLLHLITWNPDVCVGMCSRSTYTTNAFIQFAVCPSPPSPLSKPEIRPKQQGITHQLHSSN